MRVLMLMRGCPGCGKSTFIEYMGWKPYTVIPDEIRMMVGSLSQNLDGDEGISQSNESYVWDKVYELLNKRFEIGAFTVLDATNSKTEEMSRLKNLAIKYKYRIYLIDMTGIPKEIVRERNKYRSPAYKVVPDEVIERQYARFKTNKIPNGINVIPFSDMESTAEKVDQALQIKPLDLSKYKQIIHVGDIHGCATVLKEAIPEIDPDSFYIFCGDYLDRGLENAEVARIMLSWSQLPNVLLLEGNHEHWLNMYGRGQEIPSKVFREYTQRELLENGIMPNEIHKLYRKCAQMAFYKFDGKIVGVSHGGLASLSQFRYTTNTSDYIRGVGKYEDITQIINHANEDMGDSGIFYQVCGHRNPYQLPIQNGQFFLLDGGIENGGSLRMAVLTHDGWETKEFKNTVYREHSISTYGTGYRDESYNSIVNQMRSNPYIEEKAYNNISAFNFNRQAFRKGIWDKQTMRARGLFINTDTEEIIARGYSKFFNIDERNETSLPALTMNMQFPVQVYKKENGYLGILSYDKENDDLLFCSKSSLISDHVEWFKEIFEKTNCCKTAALEEVKKGYSLIFEIVDPVRDPHIIEYVAPELYLLDIVKNDLTDTYQPYDYVQKVSELLHCKCKEHVATITNAKSLVDFVLTAQKENYQYNGKFIEGFVFEDKDHYRVKLKTDYYLMWKKLRSIIPSIKKHGRLLSSSMCHNPTMIYFYQFVKEYIEKHPEDIPDIITLRDMFENSNKGEQQ